METTTSPAFAELQQAFLQHFDRNFERLFSQDLPFIQQKRKKARGLFEQQGFPTSKMESWRKTNLQPVLQRNYRFNLQQGQSNNPLGALLKCEIDRFNTDIFSLVNGLWLENQSTSGITTFPDGTVVGSLRAAMHLMPQLFEKYYGQSVVNNHHGLIALNSALFENGYFIYVPKNVDHQPSIQMVNMLNSVDSIFVNTRNLVILEENASLQLVHCDDSMENQPSFINNVTEINLEAGARLDYYKLQNQDDQTALMTTTFVRQWNDSNFQSNTIVLNGGLVRNDAHVSLLGQGAHAEVVGLYLMDRKQLVDNHVFIDHAVPHCTSSQMFKGIVDDQARAVFNGHTLVRKDAQKTQAYQSNRNIQLSSQSKVDSHPFLEIYADDVKCSHGATVGQLDAQAMFYLMQRGICERNARMLLMVAFVEEIIQKISLPNLQKSIDELVRKRLKGELTSCESCSISCVDPDKPIHFEIDMSKI